MLRVGASEKCPGHMDALPGGVYIDARRDPGRGSWHGYAAKARESMQAASAGSPTDHSPVKDLLT